MNRRSFFSLFAGAAAVAAASRVAPAEAAVPKPIEYDFGGPHAWGERYNGLGYATDPGHCHILYSLEVPPHAHSFSVGIGARP